MLFRSLSRLLLAEVSVLLVAARLAAESFVCAGHGLPAPVPAGIAARPAWSAEDSRPPRGRLHALLIFAQFKDEAPGDQTIPAYAADLFDLELPGSLSHFYRTMSFGQFILDGTVLPKRYTSEQPAAAYLPSEPGGPALYGQFVTEILSQVDQELDLTEFDNDGPDGIPDSGDDDGVVDYVFVCLRSTPYGFFKGGATGIAGLGFGPHEAQDIGIEGVPIRFRGRGEWGVVGRAGAFAQTVGMLAHEFGHSLGLPDLYDLHYVAPVYDSAGIGRWGLMGWGGQGWNGNDGPNPFCAWSLERLGWINADNGHLVEVTEEVEGLVLESVHAGGPVLRIPRPLLSPRDPEADQDYLLLEHRTRTASHYDRNLPAEGLLMWHVRPEVIADDEWAVNDDEHRKGVDLLCADGLYRDAGYPLGEVVDPADGSDNLDFWAHDASYREAHGGNMGDTTDPFDGTRFTRLDPWSNPASTLYADVLEASTALSLHVRRQGQAMVVDLAPTNWAGVVFEMPDHEICSGSAMVRPEEPARIWASVPPETESADLMVYALPGRAQAAELPMVPRADGGSARAFETAFAPPTSGVYELLVRLRDAAGAEVLSQTPLRLWSTLLEEPSPALLFLRDDYPADDRGRLQRMLQEAADELGLGTMELLSAPQEGSYYNAILAHQQREGAIVVWSGRVLDESGQAALRAFLERGGRLLLVSTYFHTSPGADVFLADMLHARSAQVPRGNRVYRSTPHLPQLLEFGVPAGCWLVPSSPSIPLLADSDRNVVALRVDQHTYRAVYVSFDLYRADAAVQDSLIRSSLAFLMQGGSQEPRLELRSVIAPPVTVGLGPLIPRVAVTNWGAWSSEQFRVGYQVLAGAEVVGAGAQEESPLEALAERKVALPAWEGAQAGAFHIRFGLSVPAREDLSYGPTRPVYPVEVGDRFATESLPGEVSRGYGASSFDYDNDGDLDLYLVRDKANQLFRNKGGVFTQQSGAAGLDDWGKGRGLAVGDHDGDGDLDLYLVNEGANRFLRNTGNGAFVDATRKLDANTGTSRSLGDTGRGWSAGFFDRDADGDLDLYLVNDRGVANRLYRNDEGLFAEDAASLGLADGGVGRGLAIGDYDRDGDADLFVANTSGGSQLFRNEGGRFVGVGEQVGLPVLTAGTAPVFGDCDGDGFPELFVSYDNGPNQLFHNQRGVSFVEMMPAEGLSLGSGATGAAFLDHDNDGDLDLMTTGPSRYGGDELYLNQGAHLLPVGHLLALHREGDGRGVTFGDYDGDGDMDWFVADKNFSRAYRNQGNQNHWLQVDLEGIGRNPDGLGARVELSGQGGKQYREVHSTYGYCSQVQPWVHFGLDAAARVDTLRVRWPEGQETVQTDVAANQLLVVKHPSLITAVLDDQGVLPAPFELGLNYPNPFNPSTVIPFSIPETPGGNRSLVTVAIYDLLGQTVRTLASEELGPGAYRATWNGRDDQGRELATGVYLCHLRVAGHIQTRKLALIR